MPPALRALLDVELAAGNEIAESLHTFPAPPVGVCVRLVRPLSSVAASLPVGLKRCRFPNWDGSSGLSDESGHFFLLGPPVLPPDPPSMDEIRAPQSGPIGSERAGSSNESACTHASPDSPLRRFERSMRIDYEKWRDGIGYDLDAIREASSDERKAIEILLVERGARDWRDVEALAVLGTSGARAALGQAKRSHDHSVALSVARYAPGVLSEEERTAMVIGALKRAQFYEGLTQALELAEAHHPPAVIEALLQGTVHLEGDVAVHFAALLMFLHGKAKEPFEWIQRPFFLTFHTPDTHERARAFRELCKKIGRDPAPYLG